MARTKVQWKWENDEGNAYKDFDGASSMTLELAYKKMKGKDKVKLTLMDRNYEFDFTLMRQTNVDTGSTRRVKREGVAPNFEESDDDDADDSSTPATWAFKEDSGKWCPIAAATGALIEGEYRKSADGGKKTSDVIVFGGQHYYYDWTTNEQVNTKTNKKRKVRRSISGVEKWIAGFPGAGIKANLKEEDEDEDDDAPPKKKAKVESAAKKPASTSAGGGSAGGSIGGGPGKTKMIKKGKGVVDINSGMQDKTHCYESGDKVYQVTLNQTNIAQNNNKFYIIQLLESDKGGDYWVWTRWGRVGATGQSSLDKATSLPAAIAQFCKKFRDKTSNDFNHLSSFTKVAGKYQLMEMDLGSDDDEADAAPTAGGDAAAAKIPDSVLPDALQSLMKLISNKKEMEAAMKELEVDTSKMPLGKIKKSQIKEAFSYLKLIEGELSKAKPNNSTLESHSSMFYTLIPHDFGMSKLPVIRSDEHLKKKMELLEVLADLEIATKMLEESKKSGKNPIDAAYASLKCDLKPLSHSSAEFKRIVNFVKNTHGSTHSAYSLEVEDVFEVNREGEDKRYQAYSDSIPNKQLLWHGSRTTNYMGILSQGMRIAPPEAPSTGYMFGKGVYFADSCSKSANYCHASPANPEGVMLLCEAALGTTKDYTSAMYMDKPKAGTHSTKGVGKFEPNEDQAEFHGGVKWPMGKMGATPAVGATSLLYHEYIVYDVAQCKINYALKVKFKYGKK